MTAVNRRRWYAVWDEGLDVPVEPGFDYQREGWRELPDGYVLFSPEDAFYARELCNHALISLGWHPDSYASHNAHRTLAVLNGEDPGEHPMKRDA